MYTLSLFGESATNGEESNKQLQQKIIKFVLEFHLDGTYIYRSARKRSTRWSNADDQAVTKSERMCSPSSTFATSISAT